MMKAATDCCRAAYASARLFAQGLALLSGVLCLPGWAIAQASVGVASHEAQSMGVAAEPVPHTGISPRSSAKAATRPAWVELTPQQQQSLRPLASSWASLSEGQKRKWLAVSRNFPNMPMVEQQRLHSRMEGWVALSPQQRAQARLNFAETKDLSPEQKAAKWQAYQALSPEQKQKLAIGAKPKPMGAATAAKPVPAKKLAATEISKPDAGASKDPAGHPARIAAAPHQVDHNTLLPQTQQVSGPPQSQ